jgi:hypothetical protein
VFSRAALVCPRCKGSSRDATAACRRCGFDFAACQKSFPFGAPPLSLLIDPAHLLPGEIERDLGGSYQKLRKRFPQIGFSFCFVRLGAGVATQEFAFWLHNSAPAADDCRAWQILVVGDLTSGRLALSVGYALEPFIHADQWEAALQEFAACIGDGQWKEGFNGLLTDARDLLTIAWTAAEQRRQKTQRRRSEESPEMKAGDQKMPGRDHAETRPKSITAARDPDRTKSQPKARAAARTVEDPAKS